MRAINHAVFGAIIGLSVASPVVACVAALASHFALDAVPHFGGGKLTIASGRFKQYLIWDTISCFVLVVVLAILRPENWLLAVVCAFLATSPDFMWVKGFIAARKTGKYVTPTNLLVRFHAKIQWSETPAGLAVEIPWLIVCGLLLSQRV